MTRPVADELRNARALIERGWTQHVFARDARGSGVSLMSSEAVCFCAVGAVERVAGGTFSAMPLIASLERAIGVGDTIAVTSFNDAPERTQAEVLTAFDNAIELAEAGQ
jgi:hypothetical protein